MRFSIIIVNYNGETYLQACIDSILNNECSHPFEIIVVDNNSQDKSLQLLSHYKKKITVITNKQNLGFSRANNIGAKAAKGEYLFFLNNDTKLFKFTLEHLVEYALKNRDMGAVAPKLLNKDGSHQIAGSVFSYWVYKRKKPVSVPFLPGAAIFILKQIFEEVGRFDERYFFYNEDLDLSRSLRKKGYKLMYNPDIYVIHFGGLATRTEPGVTFVEGYRGGLYFCKKHYPGAVYQMYRIILFIALVFPFLYYAYRSVLNRRFNLFRKAYFTILTIIIRNNVEYKYEEH